MRYFNKGVRNGMRREGAGGLKFREQKSSWVMTGRENDGELPCLNKRLNYEFVYLKEHVVVPA